MLWLLDSCTQTVCSVTLSAVFVILQADITVTLQLRLHCHLELQYACSLSDPVAQLIKGILRRTSLLEL